MLSVLAASTSDVIIAAMVPLNTALLVLMAVVSRGNRRRLKEVREDVQQTRQDSTHAAQAAASAAESAVAAARVSKDAGRLIREGFPARKSDVGVFPPGDEDDTPTTRL